MSDEGSVSEWIDRLKAGDELAAQHVWERYFERLAALANERRQKRGGGNVGGDSAWQRGNASTELHVGLDALPGPEPTPEFAASVADECRRLLALLGDDVLRSVAVWKMEGYTNEEVAEKLGCVVQTVGRKLRLIRQLWAGEVAR